VAAALVVVVLRFLVVVMVIDAGTALTRFKTSALEIENSLLCAGKERLQEYALRQQGTGSKY